MMSIDSNSDQAFGPDDFVVMTFIRNNVQTLISNQLTFLERTSQALTDNMTGLYNRHFLVEHFNTILERSKRYEEPFSVVVFDLDGLKVINDRFGHLVGDTMIKTFAKSLQHNTRRSDILARYGGDEFLAIYLMADEAELKVKFSHLDRIMTIKDPENKVFEQHFDFSYGIATYPQDGATYAELIDVADSRMYEMKMLHKKSGKSDVG
jgi:diguanylate cyclase (GGDEF)-like protein